jgi:putative transposase
VSTLGSFPRYANHTLAPKGQRHKAWRFSARTEAPPFLESPEGAQAGRLVLGTNIPPSVSSTGNLNSGIDTASPPGSEEPMATTFANLLYHIVFSTKNRLPLIRTDIQESVYEYIGGIIRSEGGVLLQIGGVPDHVHILAKFRTDVAVALMVQRIKGKSSKWLNEQPAPTERFAWQEGYGAFSVSESLVKKVESYIRTQEEHHRRVSFKDELIALLKRHRISYDERYLLG